MFFFVFFSFLFDSIHTILLLLLSHSLFCIPGRANANFNYSGLGHSADPMEILDLQKFLERVIPAEDTKPDATKS